MSEVYSKVVGIQRIWNLRVIYADDILSWGKNEKEVEDMLVDIL
jgi:hypothetical protein